MKKNVSGYQPPVAKNRCTLSTPRGVLSFFSSYVGSGSASTVHPPKISGISSTPTVVKKAQLNGNRKSTSNGKYFVKMDIFKKTNLMQT